MLFQTQFAVSPAGDRLVRAWADLYSLDFDSLPLATQPALYSTLLAASSPAGRSQTSRKLNETLLHLHAEVASMQTSNLYAYLETVMNLREIRQVAEAAFQVYRKVIDLYVEDALDLIKPLHSPPAADPQPLSDSLQPIPILGFARSLEPSLLEFQQLHRQSQDWRSLGFLTTQFNYCNARICVKLTDCERVLLSPYLRFVEEQIAHPWQAVCAAAIAFPTTSPTLATVEKIMRLSPAVADSAYKRLLTQCPNHRSRRGLLSNEQIRHSCRRDLKMFQAYLCLCILQDSMKSVADELLELCLRVLPSVGVQWELTAAWTTAIADDLLPRLESSEQQQVLPYLNRMQQIFLDARSQYDDLLARSVLT